MGKLLKFTDSSHDSGEDQGDQVLIRGHVQDARLHCGNGTRTRARETIQHLNWVRSGLCLSILTPSLCGLDFQLTIEES